MFSVTYRKSTNLRTGTFRVSSFALSHSDWKPLLSHSKLILLTYSSIVIEAFKRREKKTNWALCTQTVAQNYSPHYNFQSNFDFAVR